MLFLRQRETVWVGLSLHSGHISLIKMLKIKHALRIENFKQTQLPLHFIHDGKVTQPQQLTQVLQSLVTAAQAENCRAAISFPALHAIQKRIKLPEFLREEDCMAEIEANLTEYFPGVAEKLNFDYVRQSTTANNEGLLVAARTAELNAIIAPIEAATLQVNAVDLDVYALARAINFIYGASAHMTLLLDITSAQLIILQQGAVIFFQSIAFDTPESFSFNLRRSLQLASATICIADLKKIYLAGNISYQREFEELLFTILPLPIEIVQLTKAARRLGLSNDELDLSLAALSAFGLAIRSMPA